MNTPRLISFGMRDVEGKLGRPREIRMLNAMQWKARYRGLVRHYFKSSYRLHNRFELL